LHRETLREIAVTETQVSLDEVWSAGFASCRSMEDRMIDAKSLILGIHARWVALFLGVHLLAAAYVAHAGNGWLFTNKGGGYEFPLFWAIACFALTLLGDGAHALKSDERSKMVG
jgi:hypothetical protein